MFQILHDFDIWNMKSATFLYAGMNMSTVRMYGRCGSPHLLPLNVPEEYVVSWGYAPETVCMRFYVGQAQEEERCAAVAGSRV